MIPFHRILISSGIVFCVGFALWCGWAYKESRTPGTLVIGLVFMAAAIALTYYLRNLKRFLGR